MFIDRNYLMSQINLLEKRVDLSQREPYALPKSNHTITIIGDHPDDEPMDCMGDLNTSSIAVSDRE